MEAFDDLNVAVAVRRGTLADLGMLQRGVQAGMTVYYFFNSSNITQPPQQGEPLTVASVGIMCPAFKVLPDLGAVLGHSIATVSNLLRMPVNLVLNPFAIVELLTARGKNTCPENSMGHSALAGCGMSLLSLDDFFSELYTTNDAVWNIGYWLLSTLIPQQAIDNSQEASTFRSFLQGALVVGDATKVVGTFDIVHSVEFMDSGIQGALLGARRRLLGATGTIVSKLMGGLKSGFSSLLSLGQSVAGIASMQMSAGANFGVLISSQDPTTQYAGAAVSAPSIAWAQFTYKASLPIVLDILGTAKQSGTFSVTPVWMHLNDASDLFENIVQSRIARACLGLRVMLGYSGSLGKALYYNCMAGQQMLNGMMSMSMSVLVDVPLYRCLCVNAAGTDYADFVQQNCMALVPPSRKGFWQLTMSRVASAQGMQSVCTDYSAAIETKMYGAFDEWKRQALFSAQSVASLLDDLFAPSKNGYSGTCQNTVSNPGAFVLTPLPLSHYQICARTTACNEACSDPNSIFEYERKRLQLLGSAIDVATKPYSVLIESPLFNQYAPNPYVGDMSASTIVAIRTLPANNSVYGCQNRCRGLCLAVASRYVDVIRVMFFCLPDPAMILATVFSTNLDSFEISTVPYTRDGGIIRAVDFSINGLQLLLYVLKYTSSVAIDGKVLSRQSHEVHSCLPSSVCSRLLRSEDLANGVLAPGNVQQALFGGTHIVKPVVTNCLISSIVEIAGSVFFVAFTAVKSLAFDAALCFFFGIKGFLLQDIKTWTTEWVEGSYSINAIVKQSGVIAFWPPCGLVCKEPTCGGTCHPNLESVLAMSKTGTFVHMHDESYLFVPTSVSVGGARLYMRAVQIDATKGLTATINSVRFAATADNNLLTGLWTRASIFSSLIAQRKVRDASAHGDMQRSFPYFFQADETFSARWLQEIRLSNSNSGLKLKAFISQETTQTAKTDVTCTTLSCSGCASSNLRLLCHQAQNCALSRCLGTVVQTRNALCGVGGLIQQTLIQAVVTWHGMFMIGTELALLVAKGLSGQSIHAIVLKFPTEQFYNMLCACKDMFASVVGLGMSMGQVLSNLLNGRGLDLTGGQDIGALVGEQSLKMASVGGFFFNCITGVTLLPILAMHRWVLCMADASMVATPGVGISVKFGDVSMDTTWMQCAHMGSAFDVLNNNDVQLEVAAVVVMFVKFVVTLVMGLGETLLFGLQLFWDSAVDFMIGMVFSIQDMLYTFNLRSCKVPNYALRYVMWCSCQDEAYVIPAAQRAQKSGALWCVGSLSMTLLDGNIGIVYNPYSMDELSIGVRGVTDYINCLSNHSNPGECAAPSGQLSKLQLLVDQAVEPIAVWARCKSNYVQGVWDIGAGALFAEGASGLDSLITSGLAWGNALGPDFMQCMRDPSRLLVDYATCTRLYFSISANSTPGAYFIYQKANNSGSTEPPDACLVFSGLNASTKANSTLQTLMNDCMLQNGISQAQACDLNPLVWSGKQPHKMPAAVLHGTVMQGKAEAAYQPVIDVFMRAVAAFESLYEQQASDIDTVLFSADGDFIHDFFDCMYLGPYSRVNLMACDADDVLDCPFYARDNMSGSSRDFTACFGDVMNGDHQLPFTCGSQARRSLIKFFFRNFSRVSEGGLSVNVSRKIKDATEALIKNYTDPQSLGCWHPGFKKCSIEACAWDNGYSPCLLSSYEIPSRDVSDLIVQSILGVLPKYYALSMQDSAPWTAYYDGGPPAQWRSNAATAAIAQQAGLFASPVVTYGPEEVYNMPLPTAPAAARILGGPTWGLCTALLAQTAMSLPLTAQGLPVGFEAIGDMANLEQVMWTVQNITRHTMMEHTPFAWHKARRHAPSQSAVCARPATSSSARRKLNIGSVLIKTQGPTVQARVGEDLSFPLFGFLQGQLGSYDTTCVCADNDPLISGQCVMSTETCASLLSLPSASLRQCQLFRDACQSGAGKYQRTNVPDARECLRQMGPGVRCPELGPSDWWGLFPVDCTDSECDVAKQWVTGNSIPYDATRFLNEGRAGLRLPNFRHVNDSYHNSIHYGLHTGVNMAQPQCFDAPDLFPDFSPPELLARLFPAAQAMFDSPATASCTRFVIEVARAEAMALVSDSAGATARVQATKWKRRCAAKIRQLAVCKMHGVFYDVPPPPIWPELAECGGISLSINGTYLTPGCVVVDQQRRLMYDAHLCLAQQKGITISSTNAVLSSRDQLTALCALDPQPLDLVQGDIPLSMVYNKGTALAPPASELTSAFNLDYVLSIDQNHGREHVSHVLDWWPDDKVAMPVGYHPTAASDPAELAPALFDSHFLYDKAQHKAFYAHSALRNGSLLHTAMGAGGICRSHSAGMPMFDANTNRICTRMSKASGTDMPTMPVSAPLGDSSEAGPTFTPAFIETHFEPELCAESHLDVPWTADADDFQSLSAGGILGWQHYAEMDSSGTTSYDLMQSSFPPNWYELSKLPAYDEWSDMCDGVGWGAGISCLLQCPTGTTCLATKDKGGICFSTEAHTQSGGSRQPCFRTEHCADGMVCLADGGCSPLYVHVWNDARNVWDLEATILADSCGFLDTVHPYTQSMRGATPWETVPDLLHAHGMCSHHNWFSYRHAVQTGLCPQKQAGVLSCNTSSTEWPWVQERFDGQSTSGSSPQTMAEANMLLAHAAPCDVAFMHLQAPTTNRRMEVCSGFEGQEADPLSGTSTYLHYDITEDGWTGVTMQNSDLTDTSQWLRTYQESTGEVHVGLAMAGKSLDVPLGFLGADEQAAGVVGEMSSADNVNFFRCADRMACNNPPFTYNGVAVAYRLLPDGSNITETSLRLCGSIGYLEADGCVLDIAIFPLFAQALWGDACSDLWPNFAVSSSNWLVVTSAPVTAASLASSILYCSPAHRCLYAPRASSRLTPQNQDDGIARLTEHLNNMLRNIGKTLSAMTTVSPTRVYERINMCIAGVTDVIMRGQNNYGTLGPSGIYFAFSLTLYEIPLAWLHHCMLVTLLSRVDVSVAAPPLHRMGAQGSIPVELWGPERVSVCEDSQLLATKSVLWQIICQNKHPAYTFEASTAANDLVLRIEDIAREAIQSSMLLAGSSAEVAIFCFSKASWPTPCTGACKQALNMAFNVSHCLQNLGDGVCAHPERFLFEGRQKILLDDSRLSAATVAQVSTFMQRAKATLLENLQGIAADVDYIALSTAGVKAVPLVSITTMDVAEFVTSVTSNFDLEKWLKTDVCHSVFDEQEICKDQSVTTFDDDCLFQSAMDRQDMDRYIFSDDTFRNSSTGKTEPVVVITYAPNADGKILQDRIPICQLRGANPCIVQHYADSRQLQEDPSHTVPCDIVRVQAPPGVEIQMFSMRSQPYQTWQDMIDHEYSSTEGAPSKWCSTLGTDWGKLLSPVQSCTWQGEAQSGPDVWVGSSREFEPIDVAYEDNDNVWSSQYPSLWQNVGCGEFTGFCSLRIRMENRPGLGVGLCESSSVAPNCASRISSKMSTFRMCNDMTLTKQQLYRCSPCTKFSNTIRAAGGLFDCYASADDGATREAQITTDSITKTLAFLAHGLETMLTLPSGSTVEPGLISVDLQQRGGEGRWGLRLNEPISLCSKSDCWSDFNSDAVADHNLIIWNKAVDNPSVQFTMICSEQPYTVDAQKQCNPLLDKRRQAVKQFVEQQYRQTNGVWMPRTSAGTGLGWRANVAHSSVGMFSVMYASSERAERDRLLTRVLGNTICADSPSAVQDRICVGSKTSNAFEAVHPWLGGDFNPFEGLDECPVSTGNSLCQCACSPLSVCQAYGPATLATEFPNLPTCSSQAFPRWRSMAADDASNLCSIIKTQQHTTSTCLHTQGLLGGGAGDVSIDTADLHGPGIPVKASDFVLQSLLDVNDNGLWTGKTMLNVAQNEKYGFLRMPREHLHPAHIAFGSDFGSTGAPLVMRAVALLPYGQGEKFGGVVGADWVASLKQQWATDTAWIATLYPEGVRRNHWSCPLRAVAFWGGESATFAPISPDPLLTRTLFQQRAHPFIRAKGLRDALTKYETSNGACFYQKQSARAQIPITDADNQCGLQGMVRGLNGGVHVLSRIVNHFSDRCNRVIDSPPNAELRSGEHLPSFEGENAECDVLHRLTPFLMRTKGDGGPIKVLSSNTRSEGGDCHMGRAFLYQANIIGRQCALTLKNSTHGISLCPRGPEITPLQRALPMRLSEILFKKANRLYRSTFTTPIVQFVGPAAVELQDPEVSFGLLYSVPLAGALNADLLQACADTPDCVSTGSGFTWNKYFTKDGLVNSQASSAPGLMADPTISHANTRRAQYNAGAAIDDSLWNSPNWTWTFKTQAAAGSTAAGSTTTSRGTVNRKRWLSDRFGACNASYYQYGRMSNDESMVQSISLCEPAPTPALQTLCRAMATFRSDISNVNCQVMGGGVCLHKPGMFYLPYMWSNTNQEFIADTVLEYYTEIVEQPRFAQNMTTLCPSRNLLLSHIYQLSLDQRNLCPGYQIEYLKTVLKTLKLIGHDLLYMNFCGIMGAVNLVGAVFAVEPGAANTMSKMAIYYVQEALATAAKVIMPLLNTIIDVLFGTSSAGRVIKNIIEILCELWNFMIEKIVIPIWCILIRPICGGIFRLLAVLIRVIDKQTASNLESFISAVLGGNGNDVQSCLGSINVHIPCSMAEDVDNGTFFPNAPMATRCWVDSSHNYYTAGGSVLAGTTTNSFLACTMSDTCAVDPLRFDDYDSKTDLVPCVSCPAVLLSDDGQQFGCNSYLKRCACGVRTQKPADCMRNSDCHSVICSVTANIDFARDSVTSLPCDQCGGLGAEPSCIMDGAASTGVCACTVVRQHLHTCNNVGQSVSLLNTGGECLTMTSNDQLESTRLSFSELSIAPCVLGTGCICVSVSLPLTSGGSQSTPFAVLTGLLGGSLNLVSIMGRRLLEESSSQRWCESESGGSREAARKCTYWKLVANQTLRHHNTTTTVDDTFLLSSSHFIGAVARNPRFFVEMARARPDLVRQLLAMQHGGLWPVMVNSAWQLASMVPRNQTVVTTVTDSARRLLQDSYYTDEIVTTSIPSCAALQIPIGKIVSAFWDTVNYYETIKEPKNISVTFYQLPPVSYKSGEINSQIGSIADLFMMIPTGGVGGRRTMDALFSTISYDETLANNYITGRRFIKEISFCNYTTLTFGPMRVNQLLPLLTVLVFFFYVFSLLFSPNTFVTWGLWLFVFPCILLWAAYNLSPLCWPMMPPRLPHDIVSEIKSLIPDSFEIPAYLIQPNCSSRGLLSDGTFDPACFKACDKDPFYFVSWQDASAWWLCEIHSETCRDLSRRLTSKWSALQDMTSSLEYYADVIDFASFDSDFMHAHRVCAVFAIYHIVFAGMAGFFIILVAPATIMAIAQIFGASLELIMEAAGVEMS